MEHNRKTIDTYGRLAKTYQDKFMDLTIYGQTYDWFSAMLPKESEILELGCGPGNITRYIATNYPSFKIQATDASPEMVALARQNVPTADFRVLDCRDVSDLEMNFDAVIAGFCVPYLDEKQCMKMVSDCYHILKSQGFVYLSFAEGDYSASEMHTSSDGAFSVFFHYYSEKDMQNIFEDAGFQVAKIFRIPYQTKTGVQTHLIMIGSKR